jgi:hypothetical protein
VQQTVGRFVERSVAAEHCHDIEAVVGRGVGQPGCVAAP